MNEKQILQELHDVGTAYAEGRFLLLCMQQLYTTETEPDFHDQSTLGRTIRTVRFGGASATLSRKTNGTYDLVLLMPGMSPLCVGREHAWECARDMESVLVHDYDGAVAAVQDRYRELTDARDRMQAKQEDAESVVKYYEDADGTVVRVQARLHRHLATGLPDGIRVKINFMIFTTEVDSLAKLAEALDSPPLLKFKDLVDYAELAGSLRGKALAVLRLMMANDTYTQAKFAGRKELTASDLDPRFLKSISVDSILGV